MTTSALGNALIEPPEEAPPPDQNLGANDLFRALYHELHRLAKAQLGRNGRDLALGATTLLHEAYLNICRRDSVAFLDRNRFMAYAAKVMRALTIDHVRRVRAQKRGGLYEITSLSALAHEPGAGRDLSRIGPALDELTAIDPELAEIVDLKFFCGFSFTEIAAMRRVSERTVQRHWEKARLFLHQWMERA